MSRAHTPAAAAAAAAGRHPWGACRLALLIQMWANVATPTHIPPTPTLQVFIGVPSASPLASLCGDAEFADVTLVAVPDAGDASTLQPPPVAPATPPRPGSAPSSTHTPHATTSFPAHRAVLAAASPYFRSMFGSGMVESKPGACVPLVGVPPASLTALLRFVYCGGVAVPRSSALALAALADRLDVLSLRAALTASLDTDLESASVASEYVAAARAAGRDDVVDRCLDALAGGWATAAAAPSFAALDEPTLAALLARDDLCAPSEADVARGVLAWAGGRARGRGGSAAARAASLDRLAARVRWGAVPPSDLATLATHPSILASPTLRDYVLRGFVHVHGKQPPRAPVAAATTGDPTHAPPHDDVAAPPRGGAAARLRLRIVLAGAPFADCPWPVSAATPCPADRPCPCPPTPGAPPRGLPVVVSREATVAALKARACRDAGVPPALAAAVEVWDFYANTRFGNGPLAESARCAEVDLRDGQAVLLGMKQA